MTGGDTSAKRKRSSVTGTTHEAAPASPSAASARPAKHPRPELTTAPGDNTNNSNVNVNDNAGGLHTPANGTAVYDVQNEDDATRLLALGSTQADSPEWQATIENVVKSVVSIHFCQTCSFDTELSMSSQATGFVVDAERGYILTNRHVVCSGPFWGYVIFDNHEEVSLHPYTLSTVNAGLSFCACVLVVRRPSRIQRPRPRLRLPQIRPQGDPLHEPSGAQAPTRRCPRRV